MIIKGTAHKLAVSTSASLISFFFKRVGKDLAPRCLRNKPQAVRVLALCTFPLFDRRLANKALVHKLRRSIAAMPSCPLFLFLSFHGKHDIVSPKKASSVCVDVRGLSLSSCQFPCKHAPKSRIDPCLASSRLPQYPSPLNPRF